MIEWGLRDIEFSAPKLSLPVRGTRPKCLSMSMRRTTIKTSRYPYLNSTPIFLLLFIPNKEGDNCVILTRADTWEKRANRVDMTWIAKKLKRKWNANLKAPDILHDS